MVRGDRGSERVLLDQLRELKPLAHAASPALELETLYLRVGFEEISQGIAQAFAAAGIAPARRTGRRECVARFPRRAPTYPSLPIQWRQAIEFQLHAKGRQSRSRSFDNEILDRPA